MAWDGSPASRSFRTDRTSSVLLDRTGCPSLSAYDRHPLRLHLRRDRRAGRQARQAAQGPHGLGRLPRLQVLPHRPHQLQQQVVHIQLAVNVAQVIVQVDEIQLEFEEEIDRLLAENEKPENDCAE